jgi:hypothetical protein
MRMLYTSTPSASWVVQEGEREVGEREGRERERGRGERGKRKRER